MPFFSLYRQLISILCRLPLLAPKNCSAQPCQTAELSGRRRILKDYAQVSTHCPQITNRHSPQGEALHPPSIPRPTILPHQEAIIQTSQPHLSTIKPTIHIFQQTNHRQSIPVQGSSPLPSAVVRSLPVSMQLRSCTVRRTNFVQLRETHCRAQGSQRTDWCTPQRSSVLGDPRARPSPSS